MDRAKINQMVDNILSNSKITFTKRKGRAGYKAVTCNVHVSSYVFSKFSIEAFNRAEGVAICSPLDNFSLERGKAIALGRVKKAMFNHIRKCYTTYVRKDISLSKERCTSVSPCDKWLGIMFYPFIPNIEYTEDYYKGMVW